MSTKEKKNQRIKRELESIREKAGGVLQAERVVDFASDPETELHDHFEWDDGKAAHQHRLWQAREIIQAVVYISSADNRSYPAYVSLEEDRRKPGGGYRPFVEVMSEEHSRERALQMVRRELIRVEKKARDFQEFTRVVEAIREVV